MDILLSANYIKGIIFLSPSLDNVAVKKKKSQRIYGYIPESISSTVETKGIGNVFIKDRCYTVYTTPYTLHNSSAMVHKGLNHDFCQQAFHIYKK